MDRGIGPARFLAAVLVMFCFGASIAGATDPQAAERFRAAAAMQERALYDLAEAEYAAVARESPADPIATRARLQRGVCLFQLGRYAAAQAELSQIDPGPPTLSTTEIEQAYAYLGLAAYNLSHSASGADRDRLLDAAIASLDKQLDQFPNGKLAQQTAFFRAEALYGRGRLAAAVAAYDRLLEKYPQHPQRAEALEARGAAEQELGRFGDAVQTFEKFVAEFPQHPLTADARQRRGDALLALAEEQLAASQSPAAAKTLNQLLDEYPESALVPRALLDLARTQFAQSDTQAAEASLDQCLRRCTEHAVAVEARLLRGQLRHARGDFAGGLADVAELPADDARRSAALHIRGLCELGLNRPADAANTLATIVENDPHFPRLDCVLYDLAWAYQESSQPAEATATYARLVESFPHSALAPECCFRVGESQYAAGSFAAAADNFRVAERTATDAALREQATHKLAWCRFHERALEEAQATFERQVAEEPNGPLAADARVMAAECLFERRRFAEAFARFTAVLDDRTAGESLRATATVHATQAAAELHQWSRCLELADRALAEFPDSKLKMESHCDRGAALYELGRLDEAQRELTAVAAANPGLLQLRAEFVLGQIHVARKQDDDAVRMFFKVAYGHGGRTSPEPYRHWQAEAIYAAARVLEDTNRTDAARKLFQEIVDQYPSSERASLARQSLATTVRR